MTHIVGATGQKEVIYRCEPPLFSPVIKKGVIPRASRSFIAL